MQASPWSAGIPSPGLLLSPESAWSGDAAFKGDPLLRTLAGARSPCVEPWRAPLSGSETQSLAERAQSLTSRLFPSTPASLASSISSHQLRATRTLVQELSKPDEMHASAAPEVSLSPADLRDTQRMQELERLERLTPRAVSPMEAIQRIRAQPDLRLPEGRPSAVTAENCIGVQSSKAEGQALTHARKLENMSAEDCREIQKLKEEVRILTREREQAKMSEANVCLGLQSRMQNLEAEVADIETDWQQRCVNAECRMEDELKSWGSLPTAFATLHEKMRSHRAEESELVLEYSQEVQDQQRIIRAHESDITSLRRKLETSNKQNAITISSSQKKLEEANKMVLQLKRQLQIVNEQHDLQVRRHNTQLLQIAALEEELDNSQAETRSLSLLEHRLAFQLEHGLAEAEVAVSATGSQRELADTKAELEQMHAENCRLEDIRLAHRQVEVRSQLHEANGPHGNDQEFKLLKNAYEELQAQNQKLQSDFDNVQVQLRQSADLRSDAFKFEPLMQANSELHIENQRLLVALSNAQKKEEQVEQQEYRLHASAEVQAIWQRLESMTGLNTELQAQNEELAGQVDSLQVENKELQGQVQAKSKYAELTITVEQLRSKLAQLDQASPEAGTVSSPSTELIGTALEEDAGQAPQLVLPDQQFPQKAQGGKGGSHSPPASYAERRALLIKRKKAEQMGMPMEADPALNAHDAKPSQKEVEGGVQSVKTEEAGEHQKIDTFTPLMKSQGVKASPWIVLEKASSMLRGGVQPAPKYHPILDVAKRGIALKQLMSLAAYVASVLQESEVIDDDPQSATYQQQLVWSESNMYSVCRYFVMPLTQTANCSYVEWVSREEQVPMWCISHWWGTAFEATLDMLSHHAKSRHTERDMDTIYWMCTLANNQHDLSNISNLDLLEAPFAQVMMNLECYGTILLCDPKATPMTRMWCILEVHVAQKLRCGALGGDKQSYLLDIATVAPGTTLQQADAHHAIPGETVVSMMQDLLSGNWRESSEPPGRPFPLEIARMGCEADVRKSYTSVPQDCKAILNFIAHRDSLDQEPLSENPEYDKLNQCVRGIFASYELYRLLTTPQPGSLRRVGELLTLRADPNHIVGQGRPVFFALATLRADGAERLEIAKLLLESRARVNQVDAQNKTVMDYSQAIPADVLKLLQDRGASSFEKIPPSELAHLEDKINQELAEIGKFFSLDTFGSDGGAAAGAQLSRSARHKLHIVAAVLKRYPKGTCQIQLRDTFQKVKQGESICKELVAVGCHHHTALHYLPPGEGPVLQLTMSFRKGHGRLR